MPFSAKSLHLELLLRLLIFVGEILSFWIFVFLFLFWTKCNSMSSGFNLKKWEKSSSFHFLEWKTSDNSAPAHIKHAGETDGCKDHHLVFFSIWVRRAIPCVGDMYFIWKDVTLPFCPCSPGNEMYICHKSSDSKQGGGDQDEGKQLKLFFRFLWYIHCGYYEKIFHTCYSLYFSKKRKFSLKY